MAALLVKLNPKAHDTLAPLMRELIANRDLASMTSLGNAIHAAPAGAVPKEAVLETMFAPVGWGSRGSEDEKKFEAEWVAKWQPKPTLALEALMSMAVRAKDVKTQEIDADRMVAMVDIAQPLVKNKGASMASVFSPFVDQMLNFVDRSNEKREKAALSVIEKVFSLDPLTVFRPETSSPEFDLSKRPKNAHPDSAEGLTFRVTSHNLISTINARSLAVQSKGMLLDFMERIYSSDLLKSEAHDFVRTERFEMTIGPGIEADILKRGWMTKDAATDLFQSSVIDTVYKAGKAEQFTNLYAVALAANSLQQKEYAVQVLKDFRAAGVDLDQQIDCPKGKLVFHGTLLHFASMEATADFVGELVKSGCDTSKRMTSSVAETGISRGKEGFTPIQLAAFEIDKCKDDQAAAPMRYRFEGVLSVLRSQNARAVAHQLLDDMDLNSQSLATRETIGHATSPRL